MCVTSDVGGGLTDGMRLVTEAGTFVRVDGDMMRAESSVIRLRFPPPGDDDEVTKEEEILLSNCTLRMLECVVGFLEDGTIDEEDDNLIPALIHFCIDLEVVRMLEYLVRIVVERVDESSPTELRREWGLAEDGGFTSEECAAMRLDDVWQRSS